MKKVLRYEKDLSVKVTPYNREALTILAIQEGVTRSALIRYLVDTRLAQIDSNYVRQYADDDWKLSKMLKEKRTPLAISLPPKTTVPEVEETVEETKAVENGEITVSIPGQGITAKMSPSMFVAFMDRIK